MRHDLPIGTVTFLFTDIEGSTSLLRELGAEAFQETCAEHRRLLREAFQRHGGVEVDTQGDSFFVAFARASDAVAAAADAQVALERGAIRVRMGIHTGEPMVSDEGYVGMDVHRAARIAAAGSGGQVLLSRATRDLIDAETTDLGDHRLRDLSAPERIYQLGHTEFPRLGTLFQTNLPVQTTPLVGRDRELADVASLLRDSTRLLTLTGAGGSGKTRLGLHAAAELADAFPDGVWFVPLAPLFDPTLVRPTVARVLDASDRDLERALRDKRLLLLLDNFEQVLDAAPDVGALLEYAPDVRLLVTSRERLHLSAEREYQVPVLETADAAALFIERARRLDVEFELSEDVRELVVELDCLPLAIELAAARTKVFTPVEIRRRLRHSLRLLTGGDKDLPERQRTLRATVEWSYQLLEAHEQLAFTALGVFPGTFTAEAAEIVAATDIDGLAAFIDKSLLQRAANGRFFMLATIREEARVRLDAGAHGTPVRAAHAVHYLAFAEERRDELGADNAEVLEHVELELDNIRAAIAWFAATGDAESELMLVAAVGRFWLVRGHIAEGRRHLEHALARGRKEVVRAPALRYLAQIARTQGDFPAAETAAAEAVKLYEALGDPNGLAASVLTRGAIAMARGELATARADFVSADLLFRRIGDGRGIAIAAGNLSYIALLQDDENALELAERAVATAREQGVPAEMELLTVAFAHLRRGDADAADSAVRSALEVAVKQGDKRALAYCVAAMGAAAAVRGDGQTAACLLAAAEAARSELGVVLDPFEARIEREARAAARASEPARFDASWANGAVLGLEEAIAIAVADPLAVPSE